VISKSSLAGWGKRAFVRPRTVEEHAEQPVLPPAGCIQQQSQMLHWERRPRRQISPPVRRHGVQRLGGTADLCSAGLAAVLVDHLPVTRRL